MKATGGFGKTKKNQKPFGIWKDSSACKMYRHGRQHTQK